MSEKTIWVTGANGFVGTAFCQHLVADGHTVIGLVRDLGFFKSEGSDTSLQYVQCDPGELEEVLSLGDTSSPDIVVHCAAAVGPDRETAVRANVETVRNLISLNQRHPFRLIHISTVSVYEEGKDGVIDESTPLKPEILDSDLYGTTKAEGERLIHAAMEEGAIKATILRPGAILGVHPTSSWGKRVPQRIREKGREALPMPPETPFPWLHIDGLCKALSLCLSNPVSEGQIYDVVDEVRLWEAYLNPIAAAVGKEPEASQSASARRLPPMDITAQRIRDQLGYRPVRTFDEALQEIVEHLKSGL